MSSVMQSAPTSISIVPIVPRNAQHIVQQLHKACACPGVCSYLWSMLRSAAGSTCTSVALQGDYEADYTSGTHEE